MFINSVWLLRLITKIFFFLSKSDPQRKNIFLVDRNQKKFNFPWHTASL